MLTMLRGVTSLQDYPPGLYVNELPVPQSEEVSTSHFILGFIGEFDRGPIDKYMLISETPSKRLAEIAEPILGPYTKKHAGNQLLDHLNHARIKKVAFVRVLGSGHQTASLQLKDREDKDTARIYPKAGPGEYANIFTVEVQEGTKANTFKLILWSDLGGFETYDNLSKNQDDARYVEKVIKSTSEHFVYEDVKEDSDFDTTRPIVMAKTQLKNGSNGAPITDADRIGTFDPGTGVRTGQKLLGVIGSIVTDVAHINYSSPEVDKSLISLGEKHNFIAYTGTKNAQTITDASEYREQFDSDFGQMVYGYYNSTTGQRISGSCLSAIAHVRGQIEDSGLAVECNWIVGTDQELEFEDYQELFNNQIAAFQLKPSAKGDGSYAWRMANDYTLAKNDVAGNPIADNENRKVNRRRLNSWIEKQLEAVAAPWQGKAMTKPMREAADMRIRTFFDNLVQPTNKLETSKIESYSIRFDSKARSIDQFIQELKVKHYNTADWILLNYQGGTNVEVDV
ncbi:phage tail protein (plasmid) [Brevibacillus laterosporus]|uniref:Phage tail protein n=1 Tax=Brevibacillus laterosporus TaxID=1465 RepID=A0A518V248_BRELA|nr:phage tail protein [Brevibacillus laterosporus]